MGLRPAWPSVHQEISRRAITMCRRSISAVRTCMRFRPTARRLRTRATSMRSKRPARTTKFLSCRSAAAWQRKFPQARAPTPRRFIRRTDNISLGARKRGPVSKPIDGGSSCKIDNREKSSMQRTTLGGLSLSEASFGRQIQLRFSPAVKRLVTPRSSALP